MRKIVMQTPFKRSLQRFEMVADEEKPILPGRCPSINQIASFFFEGRPMDSFENDLQYNPIERNPILAKGFDLADLPKLIKEMKDAKESYLEALNEAVKRGPKSAEEVGSARNPNETAPETVSSK